ncbi:hypothetical protein PENANT_c008G00972 [Penicillium antarcticum]|uniref:Uncharacterized protein n=1 Tax=Penicillium antarcticum TaxID=416450 RepID=A0A1V6QAA7_9EURO|nr:hypothetical protein PENANT_c008G00972 [Penicillium antarcticum]
MDKLRDKTDEFSLKPWYPGWCKRPYFSDTFLPTFNRPDVTLVDTNGATSNQVYVLDQLAYYVAYIISEADRDKSATKRFIVEPSCAAEEEWTLQVLMRAQDLAGVASCTPWYWNREVAQLDEKEAFKAARFCIWGQGIKSYVETIEGWRHEGRMAEKSSSKNENDEIDCRPKLPLKRKVTQGSAMDDKAQVGTSSHHR